MAIIARTTPGQHALEKANPDRVRFQRGRRIDAKDGRRRKPGRKR